MEGVMLEQVLDRLRSGGRGLELRLANASAQPVRLALYSEELSVTKNAFYSMAKTWDMPCPCVERGGEGGMGVTLPPEVAFSLFIEGLGDSVLSLAEVGSLEGAWELVPGDGDRVLELGPPGEQRARVEVRWRGVDPSAVGEVEVDEEMREQLRALGYVS